MGWGTWLGFTTSVENPPKNTGFKFALSSPSWSIKSIKSVSYPITHRPFYHWLTNWRRKFQSVLNFFRLDWCQDSWPTIWYFCPSLASFQFWQTLVNVYRINMISLLILIVWLFVKTRMVASCWFAVLSLWIHQFCPQAIYKNLPIGDSRCKRGWRLILIDLELTMKMLSLDFR